jgi:hypothetical protein
MFSRCIFVLVASAFLAALPATAQTPTSDPARKYPLPTYDENWQFLSDPNRHSDPWDIVKYVQLARGMFASFGGEARESYERFGNQDFWLERAESERIPVVRQNSGRALILAAVALLWR